MATDNFTVFAQNVHAQYNHMAKGELRAWAELSAAGLTRDYVQYNRAGGSSQGRAPSMVWLWIGED